MIHPNERDIEENNKFLRIMLELGKTFDIQTTHYSSNLEQDEIQVDIIDIKKNKTLISE